MLQFSSAVDVKNYKLHKTMKKLTTTPISDHHSIDIHQLLDQLEELHPLDFRLAFGLTHDQAAEVLCIEPQTMRAYSKNNPSRRVRKLAATIARQWLSEKQRQIKDLHFILHPRELRD